MRNAFAEEMTKLAAADDRVVLLSGDIGNRLFDGFKSRWPDRFFNCGIAEQSMIGVAAGLAMSGFRPVAYTIAPFITARCLEQIRVDLCYHNLPVTIVGVGAGLSYASLGPTHHSCEDIAMMRCLPRMTVVCPADAVETRLALRGALKLDGPTYLRLGKKGEPAIHCDEPAFRVGEPIVVLEGEDVCLMGTGTIMPVVIEAARHLREADVSTRVVSLHTVKPLDPSFLEECFARYRVVATVEEHSIIGGMGSAVAEWLADSRQRYRAQLIRVGTCDEFPAQSGDQEHTRAQMGLTAPRIATQVISAIRPSKVFGEMEVVAP